VRVLYLLKKINDNIGITSYYIVSPGRGSLRLNGVAASPCERRFLDRRNCEKRVAVQVSRVGIQ